MLQPASESRKIFEKNSKLAEQQEINRISKSISESARGYNGNPVSSITTEIQYSSTIDALRAAGYIVELNDDRRIYFIRNFLVKWN